MLSSYWRNENLHFLNCNVKEFQELVHITADNIYGVITNQALVEYIKLIQQKLGCTIIDGLVGKETKQKCRDFQKENNLKVDAICGEQTREKLFDNWNFPHFKKEEFNCKCGCNLNLTNQKIVSILENIREHFGNNPVIITSGTRCQKHNKDVGGASGSRHLTGKAVDFYIPGVDVNQILLYCQELVRKGILRYTYTNNTNMNGCIHIDIL